MKRKYKIFSVRILIPLFFLLLVPLQANAETFRVTFLKLLSPHFFYDPLFYDCSDVTNDAPAIARSVNEQLQLSLTKDANKDYYTESSIILRVEDNEITLSQTSCSLYDPIRCYGDLGNGVVFSSQEKSVSCFDPQDLNTTLIPKASPVDSPCLETDQQDIEFEIAGSSVAFTDARLFINESEGFISGTLLAFVSEASAAQTDISGDPLSLFLRGSGSSCENGDDRGENAGEKGGGSFSNSQRCR